LGRGALNRRVLASGLAVMVSAVNVALEHILLGAGARSLIPGLADFRPAWNSGVSFSLFIQNSETGRHLLMALLGVIVIVMAAMMWRATTRLSAAGFGLIVGGALGNLLDRIFYGGAVFDFLSLYLGDWPLFVCNLADIAISAGVLLLALDSLQARPQSTSIPSQP
jgi:signal peptidase II